ncbi:serine hydrolase [Paenibacillus sp. SYP-B4298]|uniref:serine hydrolase n=1 Tax=Paenibacillus sp. SYP-B4298 TaxID=2996034 RepID=UPI0022DD4C83|nr:serine hydrolase [Paenibacillus sp. SYP-B4298]
MIYIIIIVAILMLLGLFILMGVIAKKMDDRKTEEHVLQFLLEHPDRSSLYIIENDRVIVNYQSDRKMPLASVVKIIIAVEFAEQAADEQLDIHERVGLGELERFYIPGTDGAAHPEWLDDMKQNGYIQDGQVPLLQVAKGMIQYSSNANTEYLLERLGLEAINRRLEKLGMTDHDAIYPISSAMMMTNYLMEMERIPQRKALIEMSSYSYEVYAEKAKEIFEKLKADRAWSARLNRTKRPRKIQDAWTLKMPSATTKQYAHLLCNIQKGHLLSERAHALMMEIMNMTPNPQSKFIQIGSKGGSTLSVLNQTLYCEDGEGNRMQLAFFIHDPKGYHLMWLENKQPIFLKKFMYEQQFRERVCSELR